MCLEPRKILALFKDRLLTSRHVQIARSPDLMRLFGSTQQFNITPSKKEKKKEIAETCLKANASA